jgi:3-dehydroquinate dehydratase/shikimate dehydrogenase
MKEIYRYEKINAETEVYGVIADPVAHSLSPHIHNAAFDALGLNKIYVPFRVRPEDLTQFIHDCHELGIKGLSVTIPHKEEILKYAQRQEERTRDIGAANTLTWKDNERIAYNTDYRAAMDCVDSVFTGDEESGRLEGKQVLVLGAGGVARAIVLGLARRGAQITIASRTPQRADELAIYCKGKSIGWTMRHSVQADLLVNCTPIGMHPNLDDTPLESKHLRPEMVVFDTVYNPEQTLLLKDAREAGCRVITGVDMFVNQAALQFRHFTGHDAPLELMRQVVRRTISAVKY